MDYLKPQISTAKRFTDYIRIHIGQEKIVEKLHLKKVWL